MKCNGPRVNKHFCIDREEYVKPGDTLPLAEQSWTSAGDIDRSDLASPGDGLRDLRAPISEYPRCLSPFGVHGVSGNIEEWTTLDRGVAPQRSSMKGAWWLPGKNTCRAATTGHGEIYRGKQVGVRCCEDAL